MLLAVRSGVLHQGHCTIVLTAYVSEGSCSPPEARHLSMTPQAKERLLPSRRRQQPGRSSRTSVCSVTATPGSRASKPAGVPQHSCSCAKGSKHLRVGRGVLAGFPGTLLATAAPRFRCTATGVNAGKQRHGKPLRVGRRAAASLATSLAMTAATPCCEALPHTARTTEGRVST